jgi:hypothetical protein
MQILSLSRGTSSRPTSAGWTAATWTASTAAFRSASVRASLLFALDFVVILQPCVLLLLGERLVREQRSSKRRKNAQATCERVSDQLECASGL